MAQMWKKINSFAAAGDCSRDSTPRLDATGDYSGQRALSAGVDRSRHST